VKEALDCDWEILIIENELYIHEEKTTTVFTHLSGYQRIKTLILLLYVFRNGQSCKFDLLMFDEVLQSVSIDNKDKIINLLHRLFPLTKKIIIDHSVHFELDKFQCFKI